MGRHVVIDGCEVPTVETSNNIWYNVKIRINSGDIHAKIWEVGESEPVDWQLNYSGATIYGNHIVIGTEYGQNNEEFWFDDIRVLPEMISISTDKESYTIGEVVNMTLEINRSAEYPQVMQLELELKEPCDEPDMLYKSPTFVMPAKFQWDVTVPMRIDYSIWISGGEHCFIATLRDPSTGDKIASDRACFNIDDVPWMEKLKSLEKEMMKTVEEAEL